MDMDSKKFGIRFGYLATDQRVILAVLVVAVFLAFAIRTPAFLNGQFVIFPLFVTLPSLPLSAWRSW